MKENLTKKFIKKGPSNFCDVKNPGNHQRAVLLKFVISAFKVDALLKWKCSKINKVLW